MSQLAIHRADGGHRRGNLQVALELYRKAESYVPDNIKLKERWILFVVHVFLSRISVTAR
jgi:kinesin family protein 22